jgi:hypothetical protein
MHEIAIGGNEIMFYLKKIGKKIEKKRGDGQKVMH